MDAWVGSPDCDRILTAYAARKGIQDRGEALRSLMLMLLVSDANTLRSYREFPPANRDERATVRLLTNAHALRLAYVEQRGWDVPPEARL